MIVSLYSARVARVIGWVVAAWLAVSAVSAGEPAAEAPPPEVLILVSAGENGVDRVAITYAGDVSTKQARQELDTLLQATGWVASGVAVDSLALAPGEPKMTSVEFTARYVVPYPEGMLPVASLIETYKGYRSFILQFDVQRPFAFAGPATYRSRQLAVELQQHPGSYRYDVQVHDPGFGKLDLPPATVGSPSGEAPLKRRKPPTALVVLLSLGAAGFAGLAVYYLAANRAAPRPETPARRR